MKSDEWVKLYSIRPSIYRRWKRNENMERFRQMVLTPSDLYTNLRKLNQRYIREIHIFYSFP